MKPRDYIVIASLLVAAVWLMQPIPVHSQARIAGDVFLTTAPQITTGKMFFVDSNTGVDDVGTNGSIVTPFATIDYAVGQCTASNGDVIYVFPGHTETIDAAADLDLDVAGITVIGLGSGNTRPQINFTTATTADMDVDAANITMINFRFTGGFDNLGGPIDINAAQFSLHNSIYQDVTGQAADVIVADANADNLLISSLVPGQYGWKHLGAAGAGGQSAIQIVGAANPIIQDFWISGNFAAGGIENVTTAMTDYTIGGGIMPWYIKTAHSNDLAIVNDGSSTGQVVGPGAIRLADDASNITEAVDLGAGNLFQPVNISNADGQSSLESNITASAD